MRERSRFTGRVTSRETLEIIEGSHAASLAGDSDQYRTLLLETRILLRRETERYGRCLAEDVESLLNVIYLKLAS